MNGMRTQSCPTSSVVPGDAQTPALEIRGLTTGYEGTTVLHGVDLTVQPGTIVALLGPNGAGKTTLLRAVSGLLGVRAGEVLLDGRTVTDAAPFRRARAGLCLIPEGRGVFPGLTVRDNLRMHLPRRTERHDFEAALLAFPVLRQRLNQVAGTMSGGQQQMLALARAYLCDPRVVLLDEVSMGLAPLVIDEIFEALATLASTGVALLLVEQYVNRALEMSDQVVLLDRGRVTFAGAARELDEDRLVRNYLGVGQ